MTSIEQTCRLAGYSTEGHPILAGAFIARMMDTYGLELSDYCAMLRRTPSLLIADAWLWNVPTFGFSVRDFIEEGIRIGWTLKKIVYSLVEAKPREISEAFCWNFTARVYREMFP